MAGGRARPGVGWPVGGQRSSQNAGKRCAGAAGAGRGRPDERDFARRGAGRFTMLRKLLPGGATWPPPFFEVSDASPPQLAGDARVGDLLVLREQEGLAEDDRQHAVALE